MREFKVSLPNRPGELANLVEFLGNKGINIVSVAGVAEGETSAVVVLVTEDVDGTRDALRAERLQFEEKEIVTVDLEDKPGELASTVRKLGNAKVNVESIYLLGKEEGRAQVALEVDNTEKAKEIVTG